MRASRAPFFLKWTEFFLKFFFLPAFVGVSKTASNLCSSPGIGGFTGNVFVCFNGGGDIFKEAWGKFYGDTLNPTINIDDYFKVNNDYESWAAFGISQGLNAYPNVPPGRLADIPAPQILPTFYSITPNIGVEFIMFPLDIVEDVQKYPQLVSLMLECVLKKMCLGPTYIMGGMIPSADDGLNSLPIHRREGAFLTFVTSAEFRTKFKRLFYGVSDGVVVTGDNFPGGLCHNHASANYPTPLKEDWTQQCNPYWTKKTKEEKCLSFQETAWGTVILKKLETIHEKVDPDHLFNCWDCVGYPKEEGVACANIKKGSICKQTNGCKWDKKIKMCLGENDDPDVSCEMIKKKKLCKKEPGCAWSNKSCVSTSNDPPTPQPVTSSPTSTPACETITEKNTCKKIYNCKYSKKKGCKSFNCAKYKESKCNTKKPCEFVNGVCSFKPLRRWRKHDFKSK